MNMQDKQNAAEVAGEELPDAPAAATSVDAPLGGNIAADEGVAVEDEDDDEETDDDSEG